MDPSVMTPPPTARIPPVFVAAAAERDLGSIRRLQACFEKLLSSSVVHGDHSRVFINLQMKNIAAVPIGNDAAIAHHFWIKGRVSGRRKCKNV
jgi:hypothetical protein